MATDRQVNLIAALATALNDRIADGVESQSGRSGAAAALLTSALAEPGLTVKQLASIVGISGSGTVRLLDKLTVDGLVQRREGSDARSAAVHLTPRGRAAAKRVLAARRDQVERAIAALSSPEQSAFARLAEKVLAGVTDSEPAAGRICRLCDWDVCPTNQCPVEQAIP
jgi:MarR family transcriptional regulator, negative regulator of the multidrug operon emrRAB